jgi:ABC-type glutathione transport system ATPase component
MVFVREDQAYPDFKVGDALRAASWFYPGWSGELAGSLMADFALPRNRAVKKLSRGMRSALGIVIDLAARAEATMLDEPYADLDAVASQRFYDRLLASYADHPRTILLSTHQVDEAAGLLERVVVMDRGGGSCSTRRPMTCAAPPPERAAPSWPWRSSPPGTRSGTAGGWGRRNRRSSSPRSARPTAPRPGPRA